MQRLRESNLHSPLECLSFHVVVSDKFHYLLLRFTAIPVAILKNIVCNNNTIIKIIFNGQFSSHRHHHQPINLSSVEEGSSSARILTVHIRLGKLGSYTPTDKRLMSPLLGYRPCLWITHRENGPYHASPVRVGGCVCSSKFDKMLS
jgi:hypothetical protein